MKTLPKIRDFWCNIFVTSDTKNIFGKPAITDTLSNHILHVPHIYLHKKGTKCHQRCRKKALFLIEYNPEFGLCNVASCVIHWSVHPQSLFPPGQVDCVWWGNIKGLISTHLCRICTCVFLLVYPIWASTVGGSCQSWLVDQKADKLNKPSDYMLTSRHKHAVIVPVLWGHFGSKGLLDSYGCFEEFRLM